MDIVLFFYNLIITILFAFCAIGFLMLYLDREDVRLIMISSIFAVFVFDNLILYMNEFLPEFHAYFSNTSNTAPILSHMSLFLIGYLYRRTFVFYDGHDISIKERGMWILLFIGMCIATFNYTHLTGKIACIALLNGSIVLIFVLALIRILRKGPYPVYEGAPIMPLWFVVTSLVLEIGTTTEIAFMEMGFDIMQGRIISIELIGILFSVSASKYLIKKFSEGDSSLLNISTQNAEKTECELLEEFANTYKLTTRERNIIVYLVRGESIAQVCDAECIAAGTVKSHTHNIYQKLQVSNRVQLITLLNEFKLTTK